MHGELNMKVKLAVYHKTTGKIVRIHYLEWAEAKKWKNKDFVTASNLSTDDYAQVIYKEDVNIDIVKDTIKEEILTKEKGKTFSPYTRTKIESIEQKLEKESVAIKEIK